MKRKAFFGFMAAALCLSFITIGIGDALKLESTSTNEFSIDGLSFHVDVAGSDDAALLRHELSKLGVQLPDSFDIFEESRTANPVFSRKLVGSGKTHSVSPPDIPRGLKTDHSLRMTGVNQTVDLIFGKMESGGTAVAARLANDGWIPFSVEDTRSPRMLQKVRGKEVTVVCLDDKEGTFLLLRKVER